METFFAYLIKSSVCILFYELFYRLFLRGETFHRLNRMILLMSLVLSLLLPLLDVSGWFSFAGQDGAMPVTELTFSLQELVVDQRTAGLLEHQGIAAWAVIFGVYLAGIILLLLKNLLVFVYLHRLLKRCRQEQTADGKNVFLDADGNRVIETVEADGSKTYALEDGTAYAGNVDDLEISVAEEKYSGIMGTLKLLSNSIQMVLDGDTEAGYEQMNATLDMFESSMNTITTEQTKFGGVYNRLEMTTSTLETNNTNLTSYLSELNDIDIATAVTEWMQAQYAYQASLQVTSASMGMSLLKYL